MNSSSSAPIYFCYANPSGFSGQKAATELVIKGLSERGRVCRKLLLPVLDRSGGGSRTTFRYLSELIAAWLKSFRLLGEKGGWFCINLGQTRMAFLRDAVPLFLGRIAFGRNRMIASLHGSLFMTWSNDSFDLRVFRFLLGNTGCVTVLGERQRRRLIDAGLPPSRVKVVVNSCELSLATDDLVEAKHSPEREDATVHCLYLGGLYDTKGFPEYLEALGELAMAGRINIEAVLCGCLVTSDFTDRFSDQQSAGSWIEKQILAINRSARVKVRWLKGARGAAKETLFKNADIFVLPTRYAVEAQPLVLLEAMASGCAIITTTVGEISTILDEKSALFLPSVSATAVASAIKTLAEDTDRRRDLAVAAHVRYRDCYQIDRHLDQWESLLGGAKPIIQSATVELSGSERI